MTTPLAPETVAQIHISAWLASQRLNYSTMSAPTTGVATPGQGPVDGRLWTVPLMTPEDPSLTVPLILHTAGTLFGVSVLLRHDAVAIDQRDITAELTEAFPYVRVIPENGSKPGLWVRAETPMDLESDPPVLAGTIRMLMAAVLSAVYKLRRDHAGCFQFGESTSIPVTVIFFGAPSERPPTSETATLTAPELKQAR